MTLKPKHPVQSHQHLHLSSRSRQGGILATPWFTKLRHALCLTEQTQHSHYSALPPWVPLRSFCRPPPPPPQNKQKKLTRAMAWNRNARCDPCSPRSTKCNLWIPQEHGEQAADKHLEEARRNWDAVITQFFKKHMASILGVVSWGIFCVLGCMPWIPWQPTHDFYGEPWSLPVFSPRARTPYEHHTLSNEFRRISARSREKQPDLEAVYGSPTRIQKMEPLNSGSYASTLDPMGAGILHGLGDGGFMRFSGSLWLGL